MYYVIQENLFKEYGFKALINHLDKRCLDSRVILEDEDDEDRAKWPVDYEIVKYIPFSEQLEVKTDRKDVFFFGSSSAGMVAKKKYNWTPGHFINENFDMEVYLREYKEHMLNSDGKVRSVAAISEAIEALGLKKGHLFLRPSADTKEFTGQLFTPGDWMAYIKDNELIKDLKVLMASPKQTQQEIRCWIIDGEPVTMSQYTIGRRVNYLNMDNNEEAALFAKKMAKIYQPARAFCLDICLYNDEYHIVELGCINHCGFYDANMGKLIDGLEKMKF